MRSSGLWPILLCLPLATACRLGFDHVAEQGNTGDAPPDTAPDAPLPLLRCGVPPQFAFSVTHPGSANPAVLDGFVAAATDTGFYALGSDMQTGNVHGYSFGFDGDALVAHATNAPVFSASAGDFSVVDTGDALLAAISYIDPVTGTALVPLDDQLAAHGDPQRINAWVSEPHDLARASDGTIALIDHPSGTESSIRKISPLGVATGSAYRTVPPDAEAINTVAIVPAGGRFLIGWNTGAATNGFRARVLDTSFNEAVAATTVNTGLKGNESAIASSAAGDRYLFAFWFKTPDGASDELWVSLRTADLQEIGAARLTLHGVHPRIAAGKDDFLVVWEDDTTISKLGAARVPFNDAAGFQSLSIVGSGGAKLAWDVVTRAGQAAVVWLEPTDAPATMTLWIDPLCG